MADITRAPDDTSGDNNCPEHLCLTRIMKKGSDYAVRYHSFEASESDELCGTWSQRRVMKTSKFILSDGRDTWEEPDIETLAKKVKLSLGVLKHKIMNAETLGENYVMLRKYILEVE